MNLKSSGIYSITSKQNGYRYIGSTSNFSSRWKGHLCNLRTNKHHSQRLQNHFNKYGEEDFVFTVVEIVLKDSLSLSEFKELLLKVEQTYLDNWDCCQFNMSKFAAGSVLGCKKDNAKYYRYKDRYKKYIVTYRVNNNTLQFGSYELEQDAIDRVNYIKSLTEQELDNLYQASKEIKGYSYDKQKNRWKVSFKVNNKQTHFGHYKTELEAINKVKQVHLEMHGTGHDPA